MIHLGKDHILIVLRDVGINYYLDQDKSLKEKLNDLNIQLFCIQVNREERSENISTNKEIEMFRGKVFIEEEYPNLIFAKNGEIYYIDNKKVWVIGGTFSVDKNYRLTYGLNWFSDVCYQYGYPKEL